jgi:hypothetical protein
MDESSELAGHAELDATRETLPEFDRPATAKFRHGGMMYSPPARK